MQTFVNLAEGAAPQQLAQLQAAQQRLLALSQHPRQMFHRARMARMGPCSDQGSHFNRSHREPRRPCQVDDLQAGLTEYFHEVRDAYQYCLVLIAKHYA